MNYDEALKLIGKHVYAKFKGAIGHKTVDDKSDRFHEDKKVLLKVLAGIDEETMQLYLNEMYERGVLRKDNGVSVYFTAKFIYSTQQEGYFD